MLEPAAEERAAEGRRCGGLIRQGSLPENFREAEKGDVRDIGAFAGLPGRTVENIHQVCEAARAERRGRSAGLAELISAKFSQVWRASQPPSAFSIKT
jgi:hypothetical protein